MAAQDDNDLSFTLVIDSGAFKIEMQKVKKETGEVSKAADAATSRLAAMEASFKKASETNSKLSRTLNTVRGSAVAASEAIRSLTRATDAMITRVGRVKLQDAFKINVSGLKDLNKLGESVAKIGTASAGMRKEFKFEVPKSARNELSLIIREYGNLIRIVKSLNSVPKFKFPAAAREEVNKLVFRIDALRRGVVALSGSLVGAVPFIAALNNASLTGLQTGLQNILQTLRFVGQSGRAANASLNAGGRNRSGGRAGGGGGGGGNRELNNLVNDAFNSTFAKLRDLSVLSSGIRNVFLGIKTATFGWQSGLLEANGDLERTTQLLRGLSTKNSIAEIFDDAKESTQKLYDLAARVPFEIKTLSAAAGKFASVGIDPLGGSLKSLSDAVSNFGGTQEVFSRATTAIQQMGGKGVVSLEELRQQLGEAVPTAIKDLAFAAGTTQADLVKKITKGTVESTRALELLFSEFERRYAGGSDRFLNTYEGVLSRLGLRWKEFQQVIGNTSYFENVKSGLRDLSAAFESENGVRIAQTIGNAMSGLVTLVRQAAPVVLKNLDAIGASMKVLFGAFVAGRVFALTRAMVLFFASMRAGAIGNTVVLLARLPGIFVAMTMQMGLATAATTAFGATAATVGAILRTAFFPILLPLTAAVAAYYAISGAFDTVGEAAEEAAVELGKYKTAIDKARGDKSGAAFLDPVLVEEIKKDNDKLKAALEARKAEILGYKTLVSKGITVYQGVDLLIKIKDNEAQIKRETEQYDGVVRDLLEKPTEYLRRATIKTEYQNLQSDIADSLELVQQRYEEGAVDLERSLIQAEKSGTKALAAEQKRQAPIRAALRRARFDEEQTERQKELQLLIAASKDATNDFIRFDQEGNKEKAKKAKEALLTKSELQRRVLVDIKKAENDFARNELNSAAGLTILGNKDDVAVKLTAGTKLLEDLQVRVDQLKQKVNDPTEPTYLIKLTQTLSQLQRQTGLKGAQLISPDQVKISRDLIAQIGQLDNVVEASEGFKKMNDKITEARSSIAGISTEQQKFEKVYLATQISLTAATGGFDRVALQAIVAKDGIEKLTASQRIAYESFQKLDGLPNLRDRFTEATAGAERYKFAMGDLKAFAENLRSDTKSFNEDVQNFGKTEAERLIARVESSKSQYSALLSDLDAKIRTVTSGDQTEDALREGEFLKAQRERIRLDYEDFVIASTNRINLEQLGAMRRLIAEQKPLGMQLEESAVGWVDRGADALTQFAETGKLAFGSLAKSILKDILRIINKMLILKLVESSIGSLNFGGGGGGGGGGLPSGSSLLGSSGIGGQFVSPTFSANGNVMTSKGPARLAQNFRGITSTPKLSIFGEGKKPEAIIPLPDGRTVPVTLNGQFGQPNSNPIILPTPQIEFNLVNNTGQQMAARQEQSGPSSDGKKLIMQIVLEGVSSPGTYRESFKSALRT